MRNLYVSDQRAKWAVFSLTVWTRCYLLPFGLELYIAICNRTPSMDILLTAYLRVVFELFDVM